MVMAAAAQGARMEGKGPWPGAWPAGRPAEEPALARLGRPHGARQRTAGGPMVPGNARPAAPLLRLGTGAATAEVGSVLYATRD